MPLRFTAQWNDDVHHVLHVAATRETQRLLRRLRRARNCSADALAEGFAYQGQLMPYRGAPARRAERRSAARRLRRRSSRTTTRSATGRSASGLTRFAPPEVDPRAGERLSHRCRRSPMLFMGEEWGAMQPFPYFCDFLGPSWPTPSAKEGARNSRGFPAFAGSRSAPRMIPDPLAENRRSSPPSSTGARSTPIISASIVRRS